MHEQWKKRKMFSNREQGIMSGLDPVPMMGGGYVPYPGMQVGGVVPQPQLFEEGDDEVNEALNMMASVTKPDVPDMPMPMMDEKVEVREEVTEDQGPDGYKSAVTKLKDTFKEEIRSYVSQGNLDNLGDYLKNMNLTYSNELTKLKDKFDVQIDDPSDKLMTSQFIDEIMEVSQIPGMENGGVVENIATQEDLTKYGINVPIDLWKDMPKDVKEAYLYTAVAEKAFERETPQTDTSRLDQLLGERRALADELGKSAAFQYKTKEGGTGGLIGKLLAQRAGKAQAMDKMLADEITAERAALKSGTSTSGRFDLPADTLNRLILGKKPTDMDTTSTFNQALKSAVDISSVPMDAAIAALAENGALPPISVAPIFHQVITTEDRGDITWPMFYRIELDLLPEEERTQVKKEEIVAKWKNKVGR